MFLGLDGIKLDHAQFLQQQQVLLVNQDPLDQQVPTLDPEAILSIHLSQPLSPLILQ